MKKTLVYGAATAAMVASLGGLSLSACRPGREYVEALYGPPPMQEQGDVETLYGPPPMEEQEDVDPQIIEGLYGAPSAQEPAGTQDFDDIDEPIEDVYGPPVEFDEMDETDAVQPALYGPPVAN